MSLGEIVELFQKYLEQHLHIKPAAAVNFATGGISLLLTNIALFSTVGIWRFIADRIAQLRCRRRAYQDAGVCAALAFDSGDKLLSCAELLADDDIQLRTEFRDNSKENGPKLKDETKEAIDIHLANFAIPLSKLRTSLGAALSERVVDYFEFRKGIIWRPKKAYSIVDALNEYANIEWLHYSQRDVIASRDDNTQERVRLMIFAWLRVLMKVVAIDGDMGAFLLARVRRNNFGSADSLVADVLRGKYSEKTREYQVIEVAKRLNEILSPRPEADAAPTS